MKLDITISVLPSSPKSQSTRSPMMIRANKIIITIPAIKPALARMKKYLKIIVYWEFTTRPFIFEKQKIFLFNPFVTNVAFLYLPENTI